MVVEKGYAKINLGLEVVNKRDDGYHDLAMIMTSIELSDELYLEDDPFSQQVKIDCDKMSHIALHRRGNLYALAILLYNCLIHVFRLSARFHYLEDRQIR